MIVIDTSVWIANLRNVATTAVRMLEGIKPKSTILIGDLILLEILQGARDAAHAHRLEADMRLFPIAEMNEDLAVTAARNDRTLREWGVTVRKTVDLLIAKFCIEEGHVLLHDDRDFVPFEQRLGLRCL